MIIEFLKPHSLNMGEDFEFIALFNKGVDEKKYENRRLLIKGVKTGKEYLLGLDNMGDNFFGRKNSYRFMPIEVTEHVTPKHLKGERKRYNYYHVSNNPINVHKFFKFWLNSDPMVPSGQNKTHSFVSKMGSNYTGSYKFQNKVY